MRHVIILPLIDPLHGPTTEYRLLRVWPPAFPDCCLALSGT